MKDTKYLALPLAPEFCVPPQVLLLQIGFQIARPTHPLGVSLTNPQWVQDVIK